LTGAWRTDAVTFGNDKMGVPWPDIKDLSIELKTERRLHLFARVKLTGVDYYAMLAVLPFLMAKQRPTERAD
jgi:hypothetical protein